MISLHSGRPKGHPVVEVIGWIGAVSVLLAYVLVLNGVIEGNSAWNATLNLIGAVGILTIAAAKKVIQSVVLNAVWAVAALIALVRIWLG